MTEEEVLKVLVNYGLLKVIRPKIQNKITDRSIDYINTLTFDNIRGNLSDNVTALPASPPAIVVADYSNDFLLMGA